MKKKKTKAKEDSFMLIDLKEDKAKELAQVISNKTARKILDYLATKESVTETDISDDLGLPLSTIHYNMKLLTDTNLVLADEFHYSEKGREVNHYKLANKTIIIAPGNMEKESFKQKLMKILPAVTIVAAVAGIIQLVQSGFFAMKSTAAPILQSAVETVAKAPVLAEDAAYETVRETATGAVGGGGATAYNELNKQVVDGAAQVVPEAIAAIPDTAVKTVEVISSTPIWANIAIWFIIGAAFMLITYFIFSVIMKKRKK